MARIPLADPANMDAEQRRVYENIISGPRGTLVGPLRAALLNPKLAEIWQQFGALLRFGTSLTPRASELAIIVTARRWNSQIEWYIHAQAAAKAGLPEAVIEQLKNGVTPAFDSAEDADIYEFTRQLQQNGVVDDATYQRVVARWQPAGVVELVAVIGYYTLVSMTLNAHEIPMPEGAREPLVPVAGTAPGGLTDMPA